MKLPRKKLAAEIARRLDAGQSVDAVSREIAALLIDSGQTQEVNSLLRDVQELRAQNDGIVEVTAVSAYPLTSDQRAEIERATRKYYPNTRKVIIHHEQNPDIVGGVSLSFPGANLDMSIRAKLNQLRTLTA